MLLILFVCSEINSLLCSVPQEADNLQTVIQLKSANVVGGQEECQSISSPFCWRLPQIVTSVSRFLLTSLFQQGPWWTSLGFYQCHCLPLGGNNFLLLLTLGLSLCTLVDFLALLTLLSSALLSNSSDEGQLCFPNEILHLSESYFLHL